MNTIITTTQQNITPQTTLSDFWHTALTHTLTALNQQRAGTKQTPYFSNLSQNTINSYYHDLAAFHHWATTTQTAINANGVEAYRQHLHIEKKYNTTNRHLTAIRWFARYAKNQVLRLEQVDITQQQRIIMSATAITEVAGIRGSQPKKSEGLTNPQAIEIIKSSIGTTLSNQRDFTMLSLMFIMGIRITELCTLTMKSYDGNKLQIIGKGNKERHIPTGGRLKSLLDQWIAQRGDTPGTLFPPINKAGTPSYNKQMSRQAFTQRFKAHVKKSPITKNVTPHDFRHTAITNISTNAGIPVAQQLAGHHSPTTTSQYINELGTEMKEALAAISTLIPKTA